MKGEVSSGREFRFIVEDVTCNIFTLSLEKEYEETLPYLKHLPRVKVCRINKSKVCP